MGTQDEATFGLIPIVQRGWARRGSHPVVTINHANKYTNVFGARSQKTFVFAFNKRKRAREFVKFLEILRRRWKKYLLFVDNAKSHKGKLVRNYLEEHKKTVKLEYFPDYSPETNPTEQCWKPARKKLSNRLLKTLPAAKYHLRKTFNDKKAMPKMFHYLRD
ncbi:MAG: IS630 family transposase [Nanoarchaeota archaeon]|nr:IS630 family transposase [Nanoarchaeota archaeon]